MWFFLLIFVFFLFAVVFKRRVSEYAYFIKFLKVCLSDTLLTYLSGYKEKEVDLSHHKGKIAVVTGGARGIGENVVRILVQGDLHVIIGCRNTKRAEELYKTIRKSGIEKGSITVFYLDTSSLRSVYEFAKNVKNKFRKIHFLINNAGIFGVSSYTESVDGYESQLATNYLGHYYLTYLLVPELKCAGKWHDKSRIVNVTSCAHLCGDINFKDINLKEEYLDIKAYTQSKLAQMISGNYLNYLFKKQNIDIEVFGVHPGGVDTEIMIDSRMDSKFGKFILKKPESAAWTIIHAMASVSLHDRGGNYLSNCKIEKANKLAYSREFQLELFNFTNQLLKITDYENVL